MNQHLHQASPSTEEFRRAALALAATGGQWQMPAAILTSATSGEGTTTAAVQLGRHLMTATRMRPVLIELNRIRPALQQWFDLDPERSLGTIIKTGCSAQSCIQRDPAGLPVIPAGDPGETLAEPAAFDAALCRAIRELRSSYDFILLDVAPVLESADVFMAARVVPHLVLVVGAGQVAEESLEQACRRIEQVGIDLAGTILVSQRRIVPRWAERLFAVQGDASR